MGGHEIAAAVGEGLGPAAPPCRRGRCPSPVQGVTLEELGHLVLDHGRARAGERDHRWTLGGRAVGGPVLEGSHELPGHRRRPTMVAGVVGELAATGLAARELDLDASSLEQLHGRDTGSWPEEIHHARHEELSPHHCSRLGSWRRLASRTMKRRAILRQDRTL